MQNFKKILVLIDGDARNALAVESAIAIAKRNQAELTLLDVVEPPSSMLSRIFGGDSDQETAVDLATIDDELVAGRYADLQALAETCSAGGVAPNPAIVRGAPFIAVIRRVLSQGYDLVIKAGADHEELFFTAQEMQLLRKCPCPVWIIKDRVADEVEHIMASVDPDPDDPVRNGLNRRIMELATSLQERTGGALHVVNAWRLQEESALRSARVKLSDAEVDAFVETARQASAARLDALMNDFAETKHLRTTHHEKGVADDIVPRMTKELSIDVLVMGTVGRAGVPGFFIGNTAETILRRVSCSVLAVKPESFVSPVTLGEDDALG